MKTFPTVVLGVFIALALIAVLVFATFSSHKQNAVGAVKIWGSLPESVMKDMTDVIETNNEAFDHVTYEMHSPEALMADLVTAIASGRGPDLVLLPAGYLLSDGDKLLTIPYSSLSRRDFQDTFIEAGEVMLQADGSKGLPFLVDPLVMYWNRSLFSAAGLSQPPVYWDDVALLAPKLSKADDRGTLNQSAAALGSWDNVDHAKAVLLSLLRQLGNNVVEARDTGYAVTLSATDASLASSADSALRFYTDFADPVKPAYSWNRSQQDSRDAFIAGKVAVYFGRASELGGIRQANPNLNFDVAKLPVVRGGGTAGEVDLTALSIPRGAVNPKGGLAVAEALTSAAVEDKLGSELHLPSVRRDASVGDASDPYTALFRASALSGFAFLDPDPVSSDAAFKRMIDGITSGAFTVSEAVSRANEELSALIKVQ